MKNLKIFLTILTLMGLFGTSFGQRESGEAVLTGGLGLSIWNIYASTLNFEDSVNARSTPTFDLAYDYGITHNFSIGGAVAYNSFTISNPNYSYVNSSGVIVYESIKVKYSRINFGIRPLYHWGKRENFEWHTGMRLGYSFWTAEVITTDPFYSDDYYRQDAFSLQVLFGSWAYFSDYMAITFEVGIGSPYLANIGLSLKL